MTLVNSSVGSDELNITDSSAKRVGKRIRGIRTARGLSQTELGNLVGLTADRIQKYENGARRPKEELLKKIASALNVSPLAIIDPNTSDSISAIYAMFELEDNYGMVIEKQNGKMSLSIDENYELAKLMLEWYSKRLRVEKKIETTISEEEKEECFDEYKNWKWNFPQSISDDEEKETMKKKIMVEIEKLQEALDRLNE